jgi:hypothetical protein
VPRRVNPFEDEDLYVGVVLAGVTSPGRCTLTGHDRKVNWDIKAGAGQSGATTTLKDIPPIEFTATFYLASFDDFAAWPEFHDLIDSTVAGPKPKALDIYHPDLSVNDIKSVVKASVGGVVHDGKGGQTIVVKFLEYRPPAPKGGSPNGSTTKKSAPDPNAAANAELAALTAQYQNTPWG